jgi:uncharacterized membrane protein
MYLDDGGIYNEFFQWNTELVPNWTGHFVLSFFGYFFPSFIAEKILMILCAFLICYGFRYLIRQVTIESLFISYLIFPFVYMFFFFMGFYNFLISFGLLLFAVGLFINQVRMGFTTRNLIAMASLLLLMFLSHALPLAIFMIFITVYFGIEILSALMTKEYQMIKALFNKALIFLAVGSVPFLLVTRYFLTGQNGTDSYMKFSELLTYFLDMKLLVGIHEQEVYYVRIFLYLVIFLFLIGVLFSIVKQRFTHLNKRKNLLLLLLAISMIGLYFSLPFTNTIASYINTRFLLFFFMFFMVWMSTMKFSGFIKIITVGIILLISYNLNRFYFHSNKRFSVVAKAIREAGLELPGNSVILPLNYSSNWLFAHYSNYLAADNDLVILENYEADTDYFPIRWNEAAFPYLLLNGKKNNEVDCFEWKAKKENPTREIDYLFIMGRSAMDSSNSCTVNLDSLLNNNFELLENKHDFELYKAPKLVKP